MSIRVQAPPGKHLFNIGDIPVAASGWYLLLVALWVATGGKPIYGLTLAVAATIALLVHELGHAFMARRFGLRPRVLLWGLGGLCIHGQPRTRRENAMVVAAGPLAGLVVGALFWALEAALSDGRGVGAAFLYYMVRVNLLWSVLNLLPIMPLDGGQLFLTFLQGHYRRERVLFLTHAVSVGVAVVGVLWALVEGDIFLAFLALVLGFINFRALEPFSPWVADVMAKGRRLKRDLFG